MKLDWRIVVSMIVIGVVFFALEYLWRD